MFMSWLSELTQNVGNAIISFFKEERKTEKVQQIMILNGKISYSIESSYIFCTCVGLVRMDFLHCKTNVVINYDERMKIIYENYESCTKRI